MKTIYSVVIAPIFGESISSATSFEEFEDAQDELLATVNIWQENFSEERSSDYDSAIGWLAENGDRLEEFVDIVQGPLFEKVKKDRLSKNIEALNSISSANYEDFVKALFFTEYLRFNRPSGDMSEELVEGDIEFLDTLYEAYQRSDLTGPIADFSILDEWMNSEDGE